MARDVLSRRQVLTGLTVAMAISSASVPRLAVPAVAKKKRSKRRRHRNSDGSGSGSGVSYAPDAEEQAFLQGINAYRGQQGIGALVVQNHLGAAAEAHVATMAAQNRGWFHSSLAALLQQFGYTGFSLAGENVADGYETASQVLAAWKKSLTHDANMRNVAFIGIGRAIASDGRWYWSTEFGAR